MCVNVREALACVCDAQYAAATPNLMKVRPRPAGRARRGTKQGVQTKTPLPVGESKIESNPCCSVSAQLRAGCAASADAGTACAVPWYVLNGGRGEWGPDFHWYLVSGIWYIAQAQSLIRLSMGIVLRALVVDVRGDRLDSSRMFPPTTVVRYSALDVCWTPTRLDPLFKTYQGTAHAVPASAEAAHPARDAPTQSNTGCSRFSIRRIGERSVRCD